MEKNEIFQKIRGKIIVSCQATEGDPFDKPEYVALFAKAALSGGAAAIRSQGIAKTKMIVDNIPLPVIGLIKSKFPDGSVLITGSFKDVEDILTTGCHIIAVDGTLRDRENLSGPSFISEIKKRYNTIVMADISTYEEGILCAGAGADCLSSTLSGYTPETSHYPNDVPDFDLVSRLSDKVNIPVIAEGRIHTPDQAVEMIHLGAWAIVVGTAITRPAIITSWFAEAVKNSYKRYEE